MKTPSTKALVFNGAAVTIMAFAVVSQIKWMMSTKTIAPCSERYEHAVGLGIEKGGHLLTASDVQAAAGGMDFGVMENLDVIKTKGGPKPAAFAISMKAGSSHPEHARAGRGGVVFPWSPRSLPEAMSGACLSYDIFLPADFDFGKGIGTLPGLRAYSPVMGADKDEKLIVHFGWGAEGYARMRASLTNVRTEFQSDAQSPSKLPRGRWVRIDQEIVFNGMVELDGIMRFWMDGELAAESKELQLRFNPDTTLDAVLAHAHFGGSRTDTQGVAEKDERVLITPFELRWKEAPPAKP